MTRYARMSGAIVAEIVETDKALSELYHADIAAQFEAVSDDVAAGMHRQEGGAFAFPPGPELSAVTSSLSDRIDADAEDIRAKYITTGAGQAMAYLEKASQAKAYLAETDPVDADYPLLVAEVGITGETVAEVATVIDTMQKQWVAICAQIEPIRIGAKEQIKVAETVAAAQAIYDAIVWPSD
ncbi:hypothetical protein [Martelella mediterranea]|uniref:Uncharacterized protein n=1 Tax=Martelella mediterranea TaxID=293089 RepID=A0A4R3NMC7_9HYPH|nr:hypothetical protein [Martelella mediterranea]TCT35363.1 hypothetical protein EDC90_102618 [Martelella mediterranea]